MTTKKMTNERLIELIAAYGADPKRWPDNEREDAVALMETNPILAKTTMDDAQSLDRILDGGKKDITNTDFLAARILKAAQNEDEVLPMVANDRLIPWRKSTWKSVAATFVITAGLGFAAGQSAVATSTRMDTAEALLSLSTESADELEILWEDLK
jgi:hypothetical protein